MIFKIKIEDKEHFGTLCILPCVFCCGMLLSDYVKVRRLEGDEVKY